MLFEHLRLVEQEAIDLINSNFTTSILMILWKSKS